MSDVPSSGSAIRAKPARISNQAADRAMGIDRLAIQLAAKAFLELWLAAAPLKDFRKKGVDQDQIFRRLALRFGARFSQRERGPACSQWSLVFLEHCERVGEKPEELRARLALWRHFEHQLVEVTR